tara:strand:+ start:272 stop:562 length:291 start_codon:yes stop_codon:yes gene_type:complete
MSKEMQRKLIELKEMLIEDGYKECNIVMKTLIEIIDELQTKNNEVLGVDSYRFDVPNDVVGCAYYSDDAYYDQEGYYMIDQDGNKVRPDEKYLVVK